MGNVSSVGANARAAGKSPGMRIRRKCPCNGH